MNRDHHQRNVLLGLYAHQLMNVDQATLVSAMSGCGDEQSSLTATLLSLGVLTQPQVDALDAYFQTQLERVGGVTQLLAAAGHPPELAKVLSDVSRSVHEETILLSQSIDTEDANRNDSKTEATPAGNRSTNQRFQKSRFHAAGGLGQVYEAQDTELNRTVALKEIKEEYADNDQSQLRFAKEAEITARLEHPGIVPVYGMGRREDGRLFYAMRFIKGKSLKEAIAEFHETDWRNKTDGEYNVALRGLLQRFIDACQAVYFAHRRGIIHRDIKPSNIMLGNYGETLVVDWGLAKPLGLRDESTLSRLPIEQTLRPESGLSASHTQLGHAVGSPSFMSPEQARGAHDIVDFRSDIYGLGATLFAIATGRPPVVGEDVISRVGAGEIDRPRAINRHISKPLEGICLRALSFEPVRRYSTVKNLIDDVERYLADEPVEAYAENSTDKLLRWSKKNRGLLLGSVIGSLGIATACLALFAVSSTRRQMAERESRVLSEELSALVETQHDLVLKSYTTEVRPRSHNDAETREHIQRLIKQAERIEASLQDRLNKAIALNKIAIHLRQTGGLASAAKVSQRALELVENLRSAPVARVDSIRSTYANVLYDQGQHQEAIQLLEAALDHAETTQEELARRLNTLAAHYYGVNRYEEAAAALQRALQIHEQQLGPLGNATLRTKNNLAMATAGSDESLKYLQDVVDVVNTSSWNDYSFQMTAIANLAYVHALRGENEAALKLFQHVWTERRRHYGELNPDAMTDLLNLASVERRLKLYACAEADYETVVSLRAEELGPTHAHTLFAMTGLGKTRLHLDRPDDAQQPLQQAYEGLLQQKGAHAAWVQEARELYCFACLASGDWDRAAPVVAEWQSAAKEESAASRTVETVKAQLAATELALARDDQLQATELLLAIADQCEETPGLAPYAPGVALCAAQRNADSGDQRQQLIAVAQQLEVGRDQSPAQLRHWLPQAYRLLEQLDEQSGDQDAAAVWATKRAALETPASMTPEDCAKAKQL